MKAVVIHDIDFRNINQRLLQDNYSLLHAQVRELREALSPRFWLRLGGSEKEQPRIYHLATELVRRERATITGAKLKEFFEDSQERQPLSLAELWAILPVVKLALLDCIREASEAQELVEHAIASLRSLDQLAFNDFVESISAVERVLQTDPAGVYPKMDFDTRDSYRRAVEQLAGKGNVSGRAQREVAVASQVIARARVENRHVGYYLVGPGETKLPRFRHPHALYFCGLGVLLGCLLWLLALILQPAPWWLIALLAIPLSQVALSILHPLVNRLVGPRRLPRMDFSRGVEDNCRTFVVIPTLLLSESGVSNLLERIEIHYLANRDPNLVFGLLTDVADAPNQHLESDALVESCAAGIRALNDRYGEPGPFYLLHRDRLWNASEGVWMGRERKRGKLDDFNDFLLGRGDGFAVKEGDLENIKGIRYVITLDTDTQLPRDSARELIGTMAHPLNRPVLDESNVVRQGYALLQPRVSISMESARKSRLAGLYSGQTGLDPYTKAVSDVYQDLFGQASYTGKGIYDLASFATATRGRFPDNTLLSHDLIEGEHVRVGLVTDVEVIDDFPATYEAFCKRKHRWVRGDWQIAMWLLPRVPDASWKWKPNPVSGLSRWKIFDNLRRSLFEIALVLFFVAALFGARPLRSAVIVIGILVFPAFAQTFFSLLRLPPIRFWRVFLRDALSQLARGVLDALVQLTFLLHQALLMADAIVRTLVRRAFTKRKLLEWESAAQAESEGGRFSLPAIYLLACPVLATLTSFIASLQETGSEWLPVLTMSLWAASPLAAEFISHKMRFTRKRNDADLQFLRCISLRTWRYFLDFGSEEDHWLVPDNVQEDPWAEARRSSPTNMGLQLVANLAAHDFGYLTHPELAERLGNILATLAQLERDRGHFYNWYDTQTLKPLPPRYISSVDSGNLAASLITLKQGCAEVVGNPLISRQELRGLRDCCELLRQSLPVAGRTGPIMRQIAMLGRQLEANPDGLYHWEGLLSELLKMSSGLGENIEWLSNHWKSRNQESLAGAVYWARALKARIEAILAGVSSFAPWLAGSLEQDTRMLSSDSRMRDLMAQLSLAPALKDLPEHYDAIGQRLNEQLRSDALVPAARRVLEDLLHSLGPARRRAKALIESFQNIEAFAQRLFHEMDFGFLLDQDRMLMKIGFDVETGEADQSHYDLLASEARTAVFLAVAKGDFPREAWFRLGRRLCSYRGFRTLLSWSGTMFEYLMPTLFLRTFEDSLLGESLVNAVRIQQLYCRDKRVPWGVSEAAHSERDAARNYQYRAFGLPVMSLKRIEPRDLVVAPYAAMLALSIDPRAATANLRQMVARGWLGDYGFFESVDFMGREPVVVRAFMAHHQGMAFTALANALLDQPMPRRFHLEPMVQAIELLLQERLPVMYDETPVEPALAPEAERKAPAVAVGQES